jgi:hypothetical protein
MIPRTRARRHEFLFSFGLRADQGRPRSLGTAFGKIRASWPVFSEYICWKRAASSAQYSVSTGKSRF